MLRPRQACTTRSRLLSVSSKNRKRLLRVLRRDGYTCTWCGRPVLPAEELKLLTGALPGHAPPRQYTVPGSASAVVYLATLEHVVRKADGGTSELSNLRASCGTCNWNRHGEENREANRVYLEQRRQDVLKKQEDPVVVEAYEKYLAKVLDSRQDPD